MDGELCFVAWLLNEFVQPGKKGGDPVDPEVSILDRLAVESTSARR